MSERIIGWQHKIKKKFPESYLLESLEIREKVSLKDFIKDSTGAAIWKKATIKAVPIER